MGFESWPQSTPETPAPQEQDISNVETPQETAPQSPVEAAPESVSTESVVDATPVESPGQETATEEILSQPERGSGEGALENKGERQAEEEKLRAQAAQGLGQLFELLPKGTKPSRELISETLNETVLKELRGGMRNKLADAIIYGELYTLPKLEFVKAAMRVMGLWIIVHAGTNLLDRDVKEMIAQAEQERKEAGPLPELEGMAAEENTQKSRQEPEETVQTALPADQTKPENPQE